MSIDTLLELENVVCAYGATPVVDGFNLRLRAGTIACLLGPSGCGKTTVLRAVAGFQPVRSGQIRLRGECVSAAGLLIPPEHRRVGMVFQDYALFPHLSVGDNVAFGLRHLAAKTRRERSQSLLRLVGLADRHNQFPHQLSGGQQQRVALARAMAPEPDLVLLDEPFSSLDGAMRERLSHEVRDILSSHGIAGLMVTHDQYEAFAVAEQIGVMVNGSIVQWDTPYQLYHEPSQRFVADFIGQGRFVSATLLGPDTLQTDCGLIRGNRAFVWPVGTHVELLLRPDDVIPDQSGTLAASVVAKAFKGAETLYTLRLDNGVELLSLFPSHADHPLGDRVKVRIDAEHLVAFETRQ